MPVALDIITNALMEIGSLAQGETPSQDDANFALGKLNRLLDQWQTRSLLVFNKNFASYTIIPNHQPHTIGPSSASPTPDFALAATAARPVKIENANLVLNNSSPVVRVPLAVMDDDWWAKQRVQGVTSTVPTHIYYSPTIPSGSIYLWPVPTVAYLLELETWNQITSGLKSSDAVTLPPGYEEALTLTLGESLAPSFGLPITPELAALASKARANILSPNSAAPRISLGVPSGQRGKSSFNWMTGDMG